MLNAPCSACLLESLQNFNTITVEYRDKSVKSQESSMGLKHGLLGVQGACSQPPVCQLGLRL